MTPFRPEDETGGILTAIVEASDDAIITTDLDGVIGAWNRAAERFYGYTAQEVNGRPVSLIIPPDRRHELATILDRIKAGERVEHYETVRQARDGRLASVSLTVVPILDRTGSIVGATNIARHLTRKRAKRALRTGQLRWESVIDAAVDGIVVIDSTGRIEVFNRGAERLFGYRALEVLGHNVNTLMPSPYHEEHNAYLARYLETGVEKIIGIGREVTALRKDGTTFPVHLSVGAMALEGERKFTGIIHDLSARVRVEEQLLEHSALAKLGEMAAVIAHEVRNPLAGIRGAIQVIGTRLPKVGKETEILAEILARIDGLNAFMGDLLLFARPPEPKLAPVDLAVLVASTAEVLGADPVWKETSVTVDGSLPPIEADAGLLSIVFANLLINGAQAMHWRGAIRVSLSLTDDTCQIAFDDAGPGIPVEVREKIFTPFFSTKIQGSGLGLPTVKRLIEAHGGQIGVACPSGGGTTFTIQLPAHGAAAR